MRLLEIVIIAVGLSMDALAISIASGGAYKQLHIRHAFRIAAFFGGFQALMPIIGYMAGLSLKDYISHYDHWVIFGILTVIGAKMIYEALKIEQAERRGDITSMMVLFVLSAATSLDALAVGVTLPLMTSSVGEAAVIIGIVTFVLCFVGVYIGSRMGHFFETKMEVIGGLALIAIGTKILTEHLAN